MILLYYLSVFLGVIAVYRALALVLRKQVSRRVGRGYLFLTSLLFCTSTYFTCGFRYYSNANTRVHGWPVPGVIFQREDESAEWLDFINPFWPVTYLVNLTLF